MAEQNKLSRRGFVKTVVATAGAAALPGYTSAQAPSAQTSGSSRTLVAAQRLAVPGAHRARRRLASFPVGEGDDDRRLEQQAFRIPGGIATRRRSS